MGLPAFRSRRRSRARAALPCPAKPPSKAPLGPSFLPAPFPRVLASCLQKLAPPPPPPPTHWPPPTHPNAGLTDLLTPNACLAAWVQPAALRPTLRLMERLYDLSAFKTQEVANSVWALSRLDVRSERVLAMAQQYVAQGRMAAAKPQVRPPLQLARCGSCGSDVGHAASDVGPACGAVHARALPPSPHCVL